MRIELGMHVTTRDGKDVGSIDKLVADPGSGEIKSAVVHKGFILSRDVEIPIHMFESVGDGRARLKCSAEQIDDLPQFSEALYTEAPPEYHSTYGYPPAGVLWPITPYPATYPAAVGYSDEAATRGNPEVAEMRQKLDLENAVIDEGSDVKTSDGEKIGEVHRVSVDTDTGRPVRLVIRKGFLFTEDLEIPVSAIESVDDDVVYLSVSKEQVREMARPVGRG